MPTQFPNYGMLESGMQPYVPQSGSQQNPQFPQSVPLDYGNNMNYPDYSMGTGEQGFTQGASGGGGGGGANYMGMAQAGLGSLNQLADAFGGGPPQQQQYTPEGMPLASPETGAAGKWGSGLDAAGNVGLASGNPYGMIAGGVAKVAGMGLSLYDKSNQRDQAKENYELMMAEYKRRQRIEEEDRAREQGRLERQEGYFGADYARNLGTELAGDWQGYRQGGQ